MTKRVLLTAVVAFMAAAIASFFAAPAFAQDLKKIRIGWQPTTTVEAQIAHAMAKTNILELNGLQGEIENAHIIGLKIDRIETPSKGYLTALEGLDYL